MTSAVAIKNFTKYYGAFKAVDDLSLNVEKGEFFGFLGPNGAGKTTTINAITGLGNFAQGEIRVMGHDVKQDYKKTRSLIGLAPQEFNFDPYLSVEEILFYTSGYFGLSRKQAKARAEELLRQFDLTSHRNDGYKKLSGGLKRRLLVARSLVHRPGILILDEPTAGIDLELRYRLWEDLKEMNRKGTTIILTTHYIEEAQRLCGRIGIIFEGKLVACDQTQNLIRKIGKDTLRIHLRNALPEVPEPLKNFQVSLNDGGALLIIREDQETLDDILKLIHRENLCIKKIDVDPASLEDVFVELTRIQR